MGNYGTAQQAQAKEEQDLAQQGVALAGQGVQFARQKQQDKDFTTYLGGGPKPPVNAPGALTAAATPPAEPGALSRAAPAQESQPGALTAAMPVAKPVMADAAPLTQQPSPAPAKQELEVKPPGFENVLGVQIMPPNPQFLTVKQYVAMNRSSGKTLGELVKEGTELEMKAMKENPNGVVNLATGMYYAMPKGETVTTQLFNRQGGVLPGTYDVPSGSAAKLDSYAANNDPRYYDLVDQILKGPTRPGAVAGEPSDGRKSKQQLEKSSTLEKSDMDAEIAARQDFQTKNASAQDIINNMNTFRTFTELPNAKNMVGILANDKVSSMIATLSSTGAGTKDYSIGIPALEEAMRNAGLNKQEQAQYRVFLQNAVQMQLDKERLMKGATSERERNILANANIGPGDTIESIRLKADMLTTAAKFQKKMHKEWRNSKMTAMDFRDSEDFNKLNTQQQDDLSAILKGEKVVPSSAKPVNKNLDALKSKVNKLLKD
jgi:hypothetical protein